MSKWDMLAVIIALVTSGMVNVIAIRRNIVLERQLWQASVRYSDVSNMNDEERNLFISALGTAVQKVCWDYGVHN